VGEKKVKTFLIPLAYFLLLSCFFVFNFNSVSAGDIPRFLTLPFKNDATLLQGWLYNDGTIHKGIDYRCKVGDPIYAAADGLAMHSTQKINSTYAYGNFVFINHQNGYASLYAHLSRVSENIIIYEEKDRGNKRYDEWTRIKKGDYVGNCGTTGTIVEHLHFEATNGEYGVGKTDSYDLYATSPFYPFNKQFNKMGDKYLWENEPPKYLEEILENVLPEITPTPSLLTRIKIFFQNLFSSNETTTENKPDTVAPTVGEATVTPTNPIYNLEFTNSPQTADATILETEKLVVVKVKNTGNTTWKKSEISANVVGGLASNKIYRHASWLTDLRPTTLDQNEVKPGGIGTFTFFVNLPKEPGQYTFSLQIVRQSVTSFLQVGSGFFVFNLNIALPEEKPIEKQPEKVTLGEKIQETVEEVTEDITNKAREIKEFIKEIPRIIFGGGGSTDNANVNTTDNTDTTDTTDESVDLPEIVIINPVASSTITNVATSTIAGTKNTATDKIYLNNSTSTVVFASSTAWQAEINLVEGQNVFEIYGENSAGVKTSTNTTEIILDSIAPSIPVVSTTLDTSATPTIHIVWSSVDAGTGLASYDFDYQIDGGEWQNLLSSTTNTEYLFTVELLKTYNFRARAHDLIDNVSEWSGEGSGVLADWPKTVVINEVAWMGTSYMASVAKNCPKHEWFELYNPSLQDIDLTGWRLEIINQAGTTSTILLAGTVTSTNYYLAVRKDGARNALININLNLIYQNVEFPDAGARLLLKDATGKIIDEVNFIPGWPAGAKTAGPEDRFYQPMDRVDVFLPGSLTTNWQTNPGISPIGATNNCDVLFGSPGRENKGLWLIRTPILYYADLFIDNVFTLTKENSPYVISDNFEISAGQTLAIDPGVVLIGRYDSSYLEIDGGNLSISGTAEEPVVFTSARDKDYGNWQLPGFDNTQPPTPGDWSRIEIKNGASAIINHAKFLYGGKSFKRTDGFYATKFMSHVLQITGGTVAINNSSFINTYTHVNYPEYNSVVWLDNSNNVTTTLEINNSVFNTGWLAIKADKQANGAFISANLANNIYENFSCPAGPLDLSDLEPPPAPMLAPLIIETPTTSTPELTEAPSSTLEILEIPTTTLI
jgi:hypothetical protein